MADVTRILIVDDQHRARRSLRALLSTWNGVLEIREASNGGEALRIVHAFRPDLVLMDVRMPGLDGLEATRQIKEQWPETKVIVFSMYPEYREEALAAGAQAFARKGDAPGGLLDLLSAVTEKGA